MNIRFHEFPSSGARDVPCGRTDGWTDGHDVDNSFVRNFAKQPINVSHIKHLISSCLQNLYFLISILGEGGGDCSPTVLCVLVACLLSRIL